MKERRSGIRIMGSLIGLVRPLMGRMFAAVTLGVLGYLCAIFLTILAGCAILHGLTTVGAGGIRLTEQPGFLISLPFGTVFTVMGIMAVLRGLLHYAEQYCNHYIAFKLLAIIRHRRVCVSLRRLCPAKLEGRDKGNLISIITTDIELFGSVLCTYDLTHCHRFPDISGDGAVYRAFSFICRSAGSCGILGGGCRTSCLEWETRRK